MKQFICYLKAVPFYIKTGIWCPHIYKEDDKFNGIIIATNKSFRISNNYAHRKNEVVHPKATIIRSKCICCGKEYLSWYDQEPLIISD